MSRNIGLLSTLLLLGAGSASAQEIRGTVTDESSGVPLRGALLVVLDSRDAVQATTLSDSTGAFELRVKRPGVVRLRADRFAYAWVESVPLDLTAGDTLRLEIRLRPQPIQLPEIVAATGRATHLDDFLARREKQKFGQFLGPLEISDLRPTSADHILSTMFGLRRSLNGPGIVATRMYERLMTRVRTCRPWVYIDGKPMEPWRTHFYSPVDGSLSVDFFIPHQWIRGVEVYRTPHDAPAEYQRRTDLDCAIILVWTDFAFGFRDR